MRFLKIGRRPRWYSDAMYSARPGLEKLSFDEQLKEYCADFFGPVDSWSTAMRREGIDATDYLCGVDQLDQAWWRENRTGQSFDPSKVLEEQIIVHKPDVLCLEGVEMFSVDEIERFREILPKDALICGLSGTDTRARPAMYRLDMVFSCLKIVVHHLKKAGRAATFFPHSFDPRILQHFPEEREIEEPVNFIGNFIAGNHMHDFRRQVVMRLIQDHDAVVYSNYERRLGKVMTRYVASAVAYHVGRVIRRVPALAERSPVRLKTAMNWQAAPSFGYDSVLAKAVQPGAFGLAQYALLRRGLMTANVHGGLSEDFAGNMRLFEATGIGVALLTDRKSDLGDFFEEDTEVVAFSSVDEASEKAAYLIENPKEAIAIGKAGQKRTLRDHSFKNRIPVLLDSLNSVTGH